MAKTSKKDTILRVAVEYFSKFGYKSTSLEQIAKECNITKPAIYYHFKDKASLYEDVVCSQFLELVKNIEKNTSFGDAEEKLKSYIVTFGDFLISHPTFSAIFAREIADGGDSLPKTCAKLLSKTLYRLMNILEDGQKEGIFEDENPFMIQMMIVSTLTSYNTTKPLRQKVVLSFEDKTKLPEVDFQNIVESLSKKIIKGLKC